MIAWESMRGLHEVVFTHKNHDTGVAHMWNITRLQAWVDTTGPLAMAQRFGIRLNITEDIAKHIAERMGIEQHRLARITPEDLDRYPVLLVTFDDGTSLVIDGNHRYLRAYLEGVKQVKCYRFTLADLEPFQVDAPRYVLEVGHLAPDSWIR